MAKRETAAERRERHHHLVNEAIRKGFKVTHDDGLWWVDQPARPRRPAVRLGSYPNDDRAWMAAAFLASRFPEAKPTARKAR
jgi:hypothetical protein